MSPTKTTRNASESSRPSRKASTPSQKQKKPFKQRKIPKTLDGVPVTIYGVSVEDFINRDTTIRVQPLVASESAAPSSLPITTPEDKVNLASSYFPPADFIHSQIPAVSTRVPVEPSHVPNPFQYDPADFSNTQPDDTFSFTNNPGQSYGRYDPSRHFMPSSSSSMEHGVEPYQQWPDSNSQYYIPQHILPYVSNDSSIFPDNSYDIYADTSITGTGSSHLMTMSENDGTILPSSFPNYDANNLHGYYM